MAEAIAVVASGINIGSLAAGIASSIFKIKLLWDQIQDAPDDIRDLIEELEQLSRIIANMEDDQCRNPISSLILDTRSMSQCLQHCNKAANRLRDLASTLMQETDQSSKAKRQKGCAKVVLKKTQIDKNKAKLEQAIRLLTLSHQCYTIVATGNAKASSKKTMWYYQPFDFLAAFQLPNTCNTFENGNNIIWSRELIRMQPELIVAKLSKHLEEGLELYAAMIPKRTDDTKHNTEATMSGMNATVMPRCHQTWYIRSIFGRFMCQSRRDTLVRRYDGGHRTERQDIEEIIADYWTPSWIINRIWRFRAIKAAYGWSYFLQIYKVVPSGSPAFRYAQTNDIVGIQRLFSQREASPFECDEAGRSLLVSAALNGNYEICEFLIREGADAMYTWIGCTPLQWILGYQGNNEDLLSRSPLLLAKTEREVDLGYYVGTTEGFSEWQQALDPLYDERPFEERIGVATYLAYWGNGAKTVRRALALDTLPPLEDSAAETLLARVASTIGAASHKWSPADIEDWRSFIAELIVKEVNLHHLSSYGSTPFLELLKGLFPPFIYQSPEVEMTAKAVSSKRIHSILSFWLQCILERGIDLNEYGRKESDLREQRLVSWDFDSPWSNEVPSIKTLTYGPDLNDWRVDIEIQVKEAVEEAQYKKQPNRMPGRWIDEEE